ncbi:MAG: hypothetical protein R3F31_23745 [Verrucomicrobiales bacterium]
MPPTDGFLLLGGLVAGEPEDAENAVQIQAKVGQATEQQADCGGFVEISQKWHIVKSGIKTQSCWIQEVNAGNEANNAHQKAGKQLLGPRGFFHGFIRHGVNSAPVAFFHYNMVRSL